MNQQYDLEDMEDYLGGRMSDSDRAAFDTALASDPELQKRLEALQVEAKVDRLLREDLLLEQFDIWEKESADKTNQKRRRLLLVSAVIILLGLLSLLLFRTTQVQTPVKELPPIKVDSTPEQSKTPEEIALKPGPTTQSPDKTWAELAKKAFIEEDFSQRLMGAGNQGKPTDPLTQALKWYTAGKYETALSLLQKPDPGRMEEFLYLRAYTYYHLQRFEKAEQDFSEFRKFPVSDRKMDAQWGEVCCMLQQMPAVAPRLDLLLKEMESSPDNPYADRARALRKALRR